MSRFAVEELAAAGVADESTVARGNLAADGDDVRAAFDFPAFKGAVIDIHMMRLRGNFAAIIGVINHQVGVGTGLYGAFAGKKSKEFGGLRAGGIDELMQVDAAASHAVCKI